MPTEIPPSPTTPTISIDASSPLMSPIPNKSLLSTKGVERPLGHSRDNSEDSINTRSGGGTAAFFGANLSAAERDIEIKRIIFTAINNGDTAGLREFLAIYPGATEVLQLLLTTTYPNTDLFYQLDEEVLNDAAELLGPSMTHLNAIQIACVLSEEDIALDILDFVARVTEEIESRKVLYEFMGRVWGNGNTVVHLASFQGMSELVKRLLQLGAASRKRNDRGYRPVDCADDQVTTLMFSTVNEADADRSPPSISSHSSLLSPQNSNVALSPILETSPAQAHYGSITEFLQSRPRGSERQTSLPTLFPDASTQESLAAASGGDYKPPAVKRQKSLSVDGGKLGPQESATAKSTRTSLPTMPSYEEFTSSITNLVKPRKSSIARTSTPPKDKSTTAAPKTKSRSVRFDYATLLLHLCQHASLSDKSYLKTIRDCLASIPDLSLVSTPQKELTPLHQACTHGHADIVQLLLESGRAEVNMRDVEGWTPLHCACAEGHVEIVKLLGRCRGVEEKGPKDGADGSGMGDASPFYPPDGPIDLVPYNSEGELPEDIALEERAEEIQNVLNDLKVRYPPPLQASRSSLDVDEEEEEEGEAEHTAASSSTDGEDTEKDSSPTLPRIRRPLAAPSLPAAEPAPIEPQKQPIQPAKPPNERPVEPPKATDPVRTPAPTPSLLPAQTAAPPTSPIARESRIPLPSYQKTPGSSTNSLLDALGESASRIYAPDKIPDDVSSKPIRPADKAEPQQAVKPSQISQPLEPSGSLSSDPKPKIVTERSNGTETGPSVAKIKEKEAAVEPKRRSHPLPSELLRIESSPSALPHRTSQRSPTQTNNPVSPTPPRTNIPPAPNRAYSAPDGLGAATPSPPSTVYSAGKPSRHGISSTPSSPLRLSIITNRMPSSLSGGATPPLPSGTQATSAGEMMVPQSPSSGSPLGMTPTRSRIKLSRRPSVARSESMSVDLQFLRGETGANSPSYSSPLAATASSGNIFAGDGGGVSGGGGAGLPPRSLDLHQRSSPSLLPTQPHAPVPPVSSLVRHGTLSAPQKKWSQTRVLPSGSPSSAQSAKSATMASPGSAPPPRWKAHNKSGDGGGSKVATAAPPPLPSLKEQMAAKSDPELDLGLAVVRKGSVKERIAALNKSKESLQ